MRDAVRDHPRFAAARTGENQQRTIDMLHCRELCGSQRLVGIPSLRRKCGFHTVILPNRADCRSRERTYVGESVAGA